MPIKHADDHSITGRETQVKLIWLRPNGVQITCWVDAIDPAVAEILRDQTVVLTQGNVLFRAHGIVTDNLVDLSNISITKGLRLLASHPKPAWWKPDVEPLLDRRKSR